jgi:hypothetical protein
MVCGLLISKSMGILADGSAVFAWFCRKADINVPNWTRPAGEYGGLPFR